MLKRARDGEPGLFPELSTATREVAAAELDLDSVARGGGIQRGVELGQEVAGVPRVAVEQQERAGRRELDYFAISEKFRGPAVKQK